MKDFYTIVAVSACALVASAANVTEPPGGNSGQGSVIEVPLMYGSVIASDEWHEIMPRPGLYELPGTGGNSLTMRFPGPDATGGGVAVDGMYYATSYENDYGSISTSTIGYDLSSGMAVSQAWGNDATSIAVDLAHDATDGKTYGIFFTADLSGYVLATVEFKDFELLQEVIAPLEGEWSSLAVDSQGQLYGISKTVGGQYGDLCTGSTLVKIDKNTGVVTEIGPTGVSPEYFSSAAIDARSGRMFWTVKLLDGTGALYELNKESGAATRICVFANNEQVTGLFIPVPDVYADAPGEVTDVTIDFPEGSLRGTFSFTMPRTLFGGDKGTGDVRYEICSGGTLIASGDSEYGRRESVEVTMATSGDCQFTIAAVNKGGTGPLYRRDMFVGKGIPTMPVISSSVADEVVTITWEPVVGSADGGYIAPEEIRYTVTRMPDNIVVSDKQEECIFSENLPSPEDLKVYYYTVAAEYSGKVSQLARTVSYPRGSVQPPYTEGFDSADAFSAYTVVDANEDNLTWNYYQGEARAPFAMKSGMDDWLFTPPLRLHKGEAYLLQFDVHGFLDFAKERLEVKFGNAASPDAMTATLVDPVDIGEAPVTMEAYIVPETEGLQYIGFHSISERNKYYMFIDNIRISRGTSSATPDAVTDLRAVPDPDGALSIELRFNAPAVDYSGNKLESINRIEVRREGEDIPAKVFENPKPGEALSFMDESDKAAEVVYNISAFNGEGEGKPATVTSYFGINYPAPTASAVLADAGNDGTVTVSWERVSTDCNGYPVNPDKISYGVYAVKNGKPELVAGSIKDLSYTFRVVEPGEQTFCQYAVIPSSERGPGEAALTAMIPVGTGYRNYRESFADGELSTVFMRETVNGFSLWRPTTDTYPGYLSSDGDNGYLLLDAYAINDCSDIMTGKISLDGLVNPGLTFATYNLSTANVGPNKNTIEVWACEVGKEFRKIEEIRICDLGDKDGWYRKLVSLDEFAGKDIQIKFRGTASTYIYILIDDIRVRSIVDNDLRAEDLVSVSHAATGTAYKAGVSVVNEGNNTVSDYTVELYADGVLVGSQKGDSLDPDGRYVAVFDCEMPVLAESPVTLKGHVVFDGDVNPENDETDAIEVQPILSNLPPARNLSGKAVAEGALLEWQAPDMASAVPDIKVESFETGVPFAHSFDDWTFIDMDGEPVGSIRDVEIPGIEAGVTKSSFFVFDASDENKYDHMFTALTGSKYLASLFLFNGGQVDDWAVSPLLDPRAQTVSFFAASFMYAYPEAIEVLYSMTGNSPSDFILLKEYPKLSNDWTEIIAELPEGARYFAIRSRGMNSFMLMIDDVSYIPAGGKCSVELLGYNVYRDGVKINDSLVKETEFTDADFSSSDEAVYRVTAVHNNGESKGSNAVTVDTSGIGAMQTGSASVRAASGAILIAGAEGMAVEIADSYGRLVWTGEGTQRMSVPVDPGVYVVRAGTCRAKVIVK